MVEAYILPCCLLLAFVVFCWLGMNKEAEFAIRRMATDLAPTTKSGFVRAMLPAIEEARNAGHTIKAIWERLRVQTPSLSYKEFCVYIRRIQERAVRMQTATHVGRKSESEVGKPGKAGFDPLKNLRRVEATRPGFQYRGTENLEELIHGIKKDDHGKQKR
jgi:hypothetical protein